MSKKNLKTEHEAFREIVEFAESYDADEKKVIKMVGDFLSAGFSVNTIDGNGYNLLHYAAIWKMSDLVDCLMAAKIDCEQRDIRKQTPLDIVIANAEFNGAITESNSILENLIFDGACLEKSNPNLLDILSCINYQCDFSKEVAQKIYAVFSDAQKKDVEKAASALTFLNWQYSEGGHLIYVARAIELMEKYGARDWKLQENNAVFLQALEIVKSGKLVEIGDKKIIVIQAPYEYHVGFFVISCSKDEVPEEVFYCDSYCLLNLEKNDEVYNYAAEGFKIGSPAPSLEKLKQNISRNFRFDYEVDPDVFSSSDCKKLIQKTFCIAEKEKSQLEIPTKKQGNWRSICAFKSTKIAMRLIAKLISSQEYCLDEAGQKPRGELYDRYKTFTTNMIDAAIDDLVEVAKKKDEPYYKACQAAVARFMVAAQRKVAEKTGDAKLLNEARLQKFKSCKEPAAVVSKELGGASSLLPKAQNVDLNI